MRFRPQIAGSRGAHIPAVPEGIGRGQPSRRPGPSWRKLRGAAVAARSAWNVGGRPVSDIADFEIEAGGGPMGVRIYFPHPQRSLPVLIYLHRGGWTMLGLDTHDRIMREYAAASAGRWSDWTIRSRARRRFPARCTPASPRFAAWPAASTNSGSGPTAGAGRGLVGRQSGAGTRDRAARSRRMGRLRPTLCPVEVAGTTFFSSMLIADFGEATSL